MLREELLKRSRDIGKISFAEIDHWIEARLQKLQSREDANGYIAVDAAERAQIEEFRKLLERIAIATLLNSPSILDSLERRRLQSIQRHNAQSDSMELV